jgi:predicted nucleotidyltransferase
VTAEFDAEGGSDVDLLVEFLPMPPREQADSYFGLLEDLERLLGVPVDLVESAAVKNPYLKRAIDKTQVRLFEAA